jgi:hypothetical protein
MEIRREETTQLYIQEVEVKTQCQNAMRFLNKNSNKICNYLIKKKEYFIQKIEITVKRLEIGIDNVNKSGFKMKFYIYI